MMDMNIVKLWDTNKAKVQAVFEAAHPVSYKDVVRAVVQMLHDASDECDKPDPERIHEIDDGDCAAGQKDKQDTVLWAQSERVCNAHKGQK